jgi:DNA-binding transcriptional ArsR family regulator
LHRETLLGKICNMSEPQQTPPAANPARAWDADLLFAALGDPVRRRILLVLADGKARTATELKGSANRKLDATLKHMVALRAGGLVVTQENPVDGRRLLYSLAPGVQVRQTEAGGREIDFGPCVVRL